MELSPSRARICRVIDKASFLSLSVRKITPDLNGGLSKSFAGVATSGPDLESGSLSGNFFRVRGFSERSGLLCSSGPLSPGCDLRLCEVDMGHRSFSVNPYTLLSPVLNGEKTDSPGSAAQACATGTVDQTYCKRACTSASFPRTADRWK